jgi:hypothetical protein
MGGCERRGRHVQSGISRKVNVHFTEIRDYGRGDFDGNLLICYVFMGAVRACVVCRPYRARGRVANQVKVLAAWIFLMAVAGMIHRLVHIWKVGRNA